MAHRAGTVAIVGRPNVGKSTLLNALLKEKIAIVSDKPQTTRNRILAVVNKPEGQLVLFDTPGIHKPEHRMNERMVTIALQSLEHVDLVLWVVDARAGYGPGERRVVEALRKSQRKVILGINKIDLLEKQKLLPVIETYRHFLDFAEIVPLSARTGEGLELLSGLLLSHLPEGERLYPEDVLTDLPERFFVSEMVRERILAETREEVPYSTGVLIESFEEGEEIVKIQAVILVEKDAHKGILIGRGGSMLKAIGTAARKEIESFLGTKVFLGLFVKVREGWREDGRTLDTMGVSQKG